MSRGYVRDEIEPALKIVPEGFQIRLQTGMIDADIMTRIGIYRYRVSGAEIRASAAACESTDVTLWMNGWSRRGMSLRAGVPPQTSNR